MQTSDVCSQCHGTKFWYIEYHKRSKPTIICHWTLKLCGDQGHALKVLLEQISAHIEVINIKPNVLSMSNTTK